MNTKKKGNIMAIKATTFTPQDWAEHEKFVQMFRAAKQRKREWQAKIEVKLAEKEERVRRRRAEVEALFDNA